MPFSLTRNAERDQSRMEKNRRAKIKVLGHEAKGFKFLNKASRVKRVDDLVPVSL